MALSAPVMGVVSGCGAEALVRRVDRARGQVRLVLLVASALLVVWFAAWRTSGGSTCWRAAVLALAAVTVPLAAVDVAEQRIPNRVLGPAFALALVLLGLDAVGSHHGNMLLRAALASGVLYAAGLALLVSARDSLGYGDVKALAYQGLYAGYLGWGHVLDGLLLALSPAAVAMLTLAAAPGRVGTVRLAFAPYLLGATLAVVLLR